MHRRLLTLLAAAACGGSPDDATSLDITDPGLGPEAAAVSLPMKGTYEARGAFTTPPTGCAGLGAQHSGGGVETHTGRYTITTHDCIVGADFTGVFTKTAASGDLIFGSYAGTTQVVQPPPVLVLAVTGTLTFTGGTGRFQGVSGNQTMTGRQTIDFTQPSPTIHTVLDLTDGALALP